MTMWWGSKTSSTIPRGFAAFWVMQATTIIRAPHLFPSAGGGFIQRLWVAALVTVAFTALARWLRGVSFSGSIAGAIICFLLYAAEGPSAFAALVSVFVLTWIATRFGYRRKQSLGTAERREGRTAWQVLANLAVATASAIGFALKGNTAFLVATAAALSEAAADTVSSELGQAQSDRARLITTWEVVPAGTDGGVTLTGTVAGIVAAAMVSGICLLAGMLSLRWAVVSVIAGVLGMVADSYLGGLLERRGWLNNDWVNFFSTVVAAGVALLLA